MLGLRTAVKRSSTSLPSSSVTEYNRKMVCVYIIPIKAGVKVIKINKIQKLFRYADARYCLHWSMATQ